MDHVVLIPHFGAGRGRLARNGRATVYAVADAVGNAAFASWTGLVGDRPASDVLDELARLIPRSAVSALAAFVDDGDALEVLTVGGAPITVDGRPLVTGASLQRQRLQGAATIELLATGQLADDPLLDFGSGVVAADGFTLRRTVAGPTPWEQQAAAIPAAPPEPASEPEVVTTSTPPPVAPAPAPAAHDHDHAPVVSVDPGAAAVVSLLADRRRRPPRRRSRSRWPAGPHRCLPRSPQRPPSRRCSRRPPRPRPSLPADQPSCASPACAAHAITSTIRALGSARCAASPCTRPASC